MSATRTTSVIDRRGRPVLVLGVALVVLLGVAACTGDRAGDGQYAGETDPVAAATATGQSFLRTYVDPDGRVVRRDEGGDTVSEGQAYALLIAVALGERQRFEAVWTWTREHLQRPDGLLSWRWADGAVVDQNSASDADIDTARALVLAGERFADPNLAAAGRELAAAVLAAETVPVGTDLLAPTTATPATGAAIEGSGLLLTGGTWTSAAPTAVNPSYFSPRAEQLFASATGDPRWANASRTQRALVWQLIGTGLLPPDWVHVDVAGAATPRADPSGRPPRFGLDAARLPIRMAESCDPADRALAAELLPKLNRPDADVVAAYSLDGHPLVDWTHPVALVGVAGAAEAAGQEQLSDDRLRVAAELNTREPTYYGSAWVALGHIFLDTELLGSCT
jgi:endo-1,4-beta-D-glucanase Y